jgi:hypothetical protein
LRIQSNLATLALDDLSPGLLPHVRGQRATREAILRAIATFNSSKGQREGPVLPPAARDGETVSLVGTSLAR